MVAREPDRARVGRDVVQSQRLSVPDQHAEDPASPWDHAERRVAGPGQLGGRLDEALEERVERELRVERYSCVEERAKPVRDVGHAPIIETLDRDVQCLCDPRTRTADRPIRRTAY